MGFDTIEINLVLIDQQGPQKWRWPQKWKRTQNEDHLNKEDNFKNQDDKTTPKIRQPEFSHFIYPPPGVNPTWFFRQKNLDPYLFDPKSFFTKNFDKNFFCQKYSLT